MVRILVLFLLTGTVTLAAQTLRSQIDEGNQAFREEAFEEALAKYQDALLDDPLNEVALFNQGAALYKLEKYDEAMSAFEKVVGSKDLELSAEALYNIGNVHFQKNELQKAITAYKKALELNADDLDTKYNLELARARLKEQSEKQQGSDQDQQQKPIQPSDFAKQLKEQAEKLVAQRQYKQAFQLMNDGLKKDPTVAAYQDFITRIEDVVGIAG